MGTGGRDEGAGGVEVEDWRTADGGGEREGEERLWGEEKVQGKVVKGCGE